MAGGQTNRILIVGKSGSGKTTLAKSIIKQMLPRSKQLIVVNFKQDLSELVPPNARYSINENGNPKPALEQHKRVFFHVTGYDPRAFLNALGREIMQRRNCLIVFDEAHWFWMRGKLPLELYRVLTAGRSLGHNLLLVTQALTSQSFALDVSVIKQCSHYIMFRLSERNEVQAALDYIPEGKPYLENLARPDDGGAPEYLVRFADGAKTGVVRRVAGNIKKREFIVLK
jgi:GTPase SAR1 family protein